MQAPDFLSTNQLKAHLTAEMIIESVDTADLDPPPAISGQASKLRNHHLRAPLEQSDYINAASALCLLLFDVVAFIFGLLLRSRQAENSRHSPGGFFRRRSSIAKTNHRASVFFVFRQ